MNDETSGGILKCWGRIQIRGGNFEILRGNMMFPIRFSLLRMRFSNLLAEI